MKRAAIYFAGAALIAGSATLAFAAPEDLLPPSFGSPPPAPTPAPAPTPSAAPTTAPAPGQPAPQPGGTSAPVVQPLPGDSAAGSPGPAMPGAFALPEDFPSLRELEAMEADEVNQLLGLRPKFDIPPAARRAMEKTGVIAMSEGGFHSRSLAGQPARLIRAALGASDGPVVSRWGHILMRRVLASRLDAPEGMNPAEFVALRAKALNAMGESVAARALVQDVDGSNYTPALTDAAFDAYLATGDVLGMCPAARLHGEFREDGEWELLQAICAAYLGEARSAERRLDRALGTGVAPEIDVRLAQRYAGAAGEGRRAVNIEWDDVDEMTPWRFALSRALGVDMPENLQAARFDLADAIIPASPLRDRVDAADRAAARGVFSSAAMVDLYAQLWSSDQYDAAAKQPARQLRLAYAAANVAQRIEALKQLWAANPGYGSRVLTAYAAARIPVSEDLADDAPDLIASMLAAGLDRNALRWGTVVDEGSRGWAQLVLVQPTRANPVSAGAFDSFVDADESSDGRRSQFLLAGLAGLGRMDADNIASAERELGLDLSRSSAWSSKISRAAQQGNQGLVALLAGVGMQGISWEQMTARQLYHIVQSLDRVGLNAEARMIAAEAVARG